jgi:hypothetical protein
MKKEVKSAFMTLRIQPSLADKIKAMAEAEHRTISAQVAHLLTQALERKK